MSLPDERDYKGAMEAIVRLQKTYNIPTEDLTAGEINNISAKYGLEENDYLEMGRLYMDVEHGTAMSWFEMYLNSENQESEGTVEAYANIMQTYQQVLWLCIFLDCHMFYRYILLLIIIYVERSP